MTVRQLLHEKRKDIEKLAVKHGALDVRVFGSVARGDERPDSDIDLLVKTGENTSAWFPGGLIVELEELLGCKVEVITEKALNPLVRDHVMSEASPL